MSGTERIAVAVRPSTLSAEEARLAVAREWDRYESMLRAFLPNDWDRATSLPGWTVRDLVAHTAWTTSMHADALRRWRRGQDGPAEGHACDPSLPPQRLLAEQLASSGELRGELLHVVERSTANGRAHRRVCLPSGTLPLDVVLQLVTMEAGVHARDLADATGAAGPLADDVAAATAAALGAWLPVMGRAAEQRPQAGTTIELRSPSVGLRLGFVRRVWSVVSEPAAGEVISADDDSTLLLFALGRAPTDAVHGADAARRLFKTWFPGP